MKVNGVEVSENMGYEGVADLFMSTAVGKSTGVTREEFIRRLKAQYPDEAELSKIITESYLQFMTLAAGGPSH